MQHQDHTEAKPQVASEVVEAAQTQQRVAAYNKTEAGLAKLRDKFQGATFDLTTTKGDKEARQARKELVTLRTTLEALRKEKKAPHLAACKLLDDEAKRINGEILALEKPIDEQIRADELRREQERAQREAEERARMEKARARISEIQRMSASVMSGTSIQIRARIDEVKAIVIDESEFGDLTGAATSTVEMVAMQLESLLSTVVMREEQAEVMRKQREEHEAALRKQQEELAAQRAELERQRQEAEQAAAEARRQIEESKRQSELASTQAREAMAAEARAAQAAMDAAKVDEPAVVPPVDQVDAFAAERVEATTQVVEQVKQVKAEIKAERAAIVDEVFSEQMPEDEPEAAVPAPLEPQRDATPEPVKPQGVVMQTVSGKPAENLPTANDVVEMVSLKYALRKDVALALLRNLFGA